MLNNTSPEYETQFEYPQGAVIAEQWQAIKPFDTHVSNSNPYPVQCFPDVAQHAINEYVAYAKAPTAMAGTSCLSYITIACQHIANVARDNQLIAPLSLNTLTIASSGERKTSCDSTFGKAIHAFEKEKTISQVDDFTANKARRDILEAQRKSIMKQMEGKKTVDGELEKILKNKTHPNYKSLVWANFYYTNRIRKTVKLHNIFYAANSPLSLNPGVLSIIKPFVKISNKRK